MKETLAVCLPNDGLNMAVCDGVLYALQGRQLHMFSLPAMKELNRERVLARQGRARDLLLFGGRIWVRDFCDLYEFDAVSLALLNTWRIGQDASSDICAFCAGGEAVYCCLRGGGLAVINIHTGNIHATVLDGGSAWDIASGDESLFYGTTAGEVVKLRKADLLPDCRKAVHRKNIYSILKQPGTLYTLSGDGFLLTLDPDDLEIRKTMRMTRKGICSICGVWRDSPVISDPKHSKVHLWESGKAAAERVLCFPTGGLSRHGIILPNNLLIGSDAQGIHILDLAREGTGC